VDRKSRFCHMVPLAGSEFCHYHQTPGQQNEQGKSYVECEHCHDRIQSDRLAKHHKKCNGIKKQGAKNEPYYREDVNAGSDTEEGLEGPSSASCKPLSEMTPDEMKDIRARVQAAYTRAVPAIEASAPFRPPSSLPPVNYRAGNGTRFVNMLCASPTGKRPF